VRCGRNAALDDRESDLFNVNVWRFRFPQTAIDSKFGEAHEKLTRHLSAKKAVISTSINNVNLALDIVGFAAIISPLTYLLVKN